MCHGNISDKVENKKHEHALKTLQQHLKKIFMDLFYDESKNTSGIYPDNLGPSDRFRLYSSAENYLILISVDHFI